MSRPCALGQVISLLWASVPPTPTENMIGPGDFQHEDSLTLIFHRSAPIPAAGPKRAHLSLRAQYPHCGPAAMATKIDKEACRTAYNLVRDDSSAVIWVTFKYDGSTIVPGEQGAEYQDFIQQCTDDVRLFAFVRFTTGDAMSKRSKFALITWIGENVSGLQRAKTGTDKTLVKEVVQNFAKEFVISDRKELEEDFIKNELKKAGGANYDAQTE